MRNKNNGHTDDAYASDYASIMESVGGGFDPAEDLLDDPALAESQLTEAAEAQSPDALAVEYVTRDLFKGKSLRASVRKFLRKFVGVDNLFLGKVSYTEPELTAIVITSKAQLAIENSKHIKDGKKHIAVIGTAEQFNIPVDVLRARVSELLDGNDPEGLLFVESVNEWTCQCGHTRPPTINECRACGDTLMEAEDGTHKFSNTMVKLSGDAAKKIKAFAKAIADADIYIDDDDDSFGREDAPHITVKYGVHSADPKSVTKAIEGSGTIKVKLGKMSTFEADDYDVLKVDVTSPQLTKLNKAIAGATKVTDTHPDYKPHATVAYLKKGKADQYVGDETLNGTEVEFDAVVFSGKDGKETSISTAVNESIEVDGDVGIEVDNLFAFFMFDTNMDIERLASFTDYIKGMGYTTNESRDHYKALYNRWPERQPYELTEGFDPIKQGKALARQFQSQLKRSRKDMNKMRAVHRSIRNAVELFLDAPMQFGPDSNEAAQGRVFIDELARLGIRYDLEENMNKAIVEIKSSEKPHEIRRKIEEAAQTCDHLTVVLEHKALRRILPPLDPATITVMEASDAMILVGRLTERAVQGPYRGKVEHKGDSFNVYATASRDTFVFRPVEEGHEHGLHIEVNRTDLEPGVLSRLESVERKGGLQEAVPYDNLFVRAVVNFLMDNPHTTPSELQRAAAWGEFGDDVPADTTDAARWQEILARGPALTYEKLYALIANMFGIRESIQEYRGRQMNLPMGKVPHGQKEVYLEDVLKEFPKGKWENHGDMDYIEYGGNQIKFMGDYWDVLELVTPDSGYPGYIIQETSVDLRDIFDNYDETEPASWHTPSKRAMNVASFTGDEDAWADGEYARFLSGVVSGWMAYYGGGGQEETFMWEEYDLDPNDVDEDSEDYERMIDDIRYTLKQQGINESITEGVKDDPWLSQLASMASQSAMLKRVRINKYGLAFSVNGTPFLINLQRKGKGFVVINARAKKQPRPSVTGVADSLAFAAGKSVDQIMDKKRGPWTGKVWDNPGDLAQAVERVVKYGIDNPNVDKYAGEFGARTDAEADDPGFKARKHTRMFGVSEAIQEAVVAKATISQRPNGMYVGQIVWSDGDISSTTGNTADDVKRFMADHGVPNSVLTIESIQEGDREEYNRDLALRAKNAPRHRRSYDDDEDQMRRCPACGGGPIEIMGYLGKHKKGKCRACGMILHLDESINEMGNVPDRHQLKVLKQVLRAPDAMVGIMGGGFNNKDEVRQILRDKFGYSDARIARLEA